MKYLLLFILLPFIALAQPRDTSAYEVQRARINNLLAQRSAKFGIYDESLKARTGIFGLQTKQDIRNSNEILRQIALNDNEIFRELKVLMDFKDLQAQRIQADASETSSKVMIYRETIKKLQDQNAFLTKYNAALVSQNHNRNYLITLLLFAMAGMGYIFYRKFRRSPKIMG